MKGFGKSIHGTATRAKSNNMICKSQASTDHNTCYKQNDIILHPTHKRYEELESCLKWSLAPKQFILTKVISGTQKHVYHYMIKVRLRTSAPLDDNKKRKIPKKTVKKDYLWHKLIPNTQIAI